MKRNNLILSIILFCTILVFIPWCSRTEKNNDYYKTLSLGTKAAEKLDAESAFGYFHDAIAIDPNKPDAYEAIGSSLILTKDDELIKEWLDYLNKAVKLWANSSIYTAIAYANMKLWNHQAALDSYDMIINDNTSSDKVIAQSYATKAIMLLNIYWNEKREEVIKNINKAIDIDPYNPDILYAKSLVEKN